MPPIDYKNACIYTIKCMLEEKNYLYIDHTTNFKRRKFCHKANSLNAVNEPLYRYINENGGWDNWEMKILENIKCANKAECLQKQNEWIEKLKGSKNPPILLNFPPNLLIFPPDLLNSPPILLNSEGPDATKPYSCDYCKKQYTRKDNMKRHILKCEAKKEVLNSIKATEQALERCKQQIAEQQLQLSQIQQAAPVGTIQKNNVRSNVRNNQNNNLSTNLNTNVKNSNVNSNNITNNNIVYRVEFGKENIHDRLTQDMKLWILNGMHTSLTRLIDHIHFSGNHPECQNFFLTNLRGKYIQVYSEADKKFITKPVNDFLEHVIVTRLDDLTIMYIELKDILEDVKSERMKHFLDLMESSGDTMSKRFVEILNALKIAAYNNKDKVDVRGQTIESYQYPDQESEQSAM